MEFSPTLILDEVRQSNNWAIGSPFITVGGLAKLCITDIVGSKHHQFLLIRDVLVIELELTSHKKKLGGVVMRANVEYNYEVIESKTIDEKFVLRCQMFGGMSGPYEILLSNCQNISSLIFKGDFMSSESLLAFSGIYYYVTLLTTWSEKDYFKFVNVFPANARPCQLNRTATKLLEDFSSNLHINDMYFKVELRREAIVFVGSQNSEKTLILNMLFNREIYLYEQWAEQCTFGYVFVNAVCDFPGGRKPMTLVDTEELKDDIKIIKNLVYRVKAKNIKAYIYILSLDHVISQNFVMLNETLELAKCYKVKLKVIVTHPQIITPEEMETHKAVLNDRNIDAVFICTDINNRALFILNVAKIAQCFENLYIETKVCVSNNS